MRTHYSSRLILLVLAILTLISIPVLGAVFPVFYVQTFIFDRLAIILYPDGINFRLVMAACFILFIGLMIPLIKQNKFTYSLLFVFMAGGLFVFYLSILSYTYIGKEQVVSNKLFDEKIFQWSEIEEVVLEYYVDDIDTHEEYIFTSIEGDSIRIPLNGQFLQEDKSEIYRVAKQNNVEFIEQEKM
ncbi:hypothetical protein MKZ25_10980 [Solibacillus sp. FSL W7-1464]|uniref:hypothetical protein n=1 Tax=Solibacillus sp. FSL W7-1464 TaxID=2921706 RepID=UPI0030F7D06D